MYFFLMKIYKFRLRFHSSLFPRVQLTIFQHWFRKWLGTSQWWPTLLTHICITWPQRVNLLGDERDVVVISKVLSPNMCYGLSSWVLLVTLLTGKCHRTPLMTSQHWFGYWLGAVRQQSITWANIDTDLCHHMASLSHNELNQQWIWDIDK